MERTRAARHGWRPPPGSCGTRLARRERPGHRLPFSTPWAGGACSSPVPALRLRGGHPRFLWGPEAPGGIGSPLPPRERRSPTPQSAGRRVPNQDAADLSSAVSRRWTGQVAVPVETGRWMIPDHGPAWQGIDGGGGIRTHGPLRDVRFQGGCIQPLCHPSRPLSLTSRPGSATPPGRVGFRIIRAPARAAG